jgi:DNA-binding SARP family transcriptional activator
MASHLKLHLFLLGGFRVAVDDREIPAAEWRRGPSAALVKLLALAGGHRMHREQAMEALWPAASPESSAGNLRKAVHFARRTLGDHEAIGFENDIVSLAPSGEVTVDAETFEADAKLALRGSRPDPVACLRAADLYGGELLPDDRYTEWSEATRENLRQLYVRVLKAGALWERLLELDPTDEEAQRNVMQAALDAGNRGEVIRRFRQLRERLRIDLGVGPSKATVAIYERALDGENQPASLLDRVRASLAWGIIHLHSGDFQKAEQIAKEARTLALEGGLAREMGEASALLGLVSHMQGRFPQLFRAEFIEWVRREPAAASIASNIFDGHLCLAEFCLYGARHTEIATAARDLLAEAEKSKSAAGLALAKLILGEDELFSGDLDVAEMLLKEAGQLYEGMDAVAGQVMVLQRLAEIAVARGQWWAAGRLVQKGFRVAETNWLEPHLLLRLQALAVATAATAEKAVDAIAIGDQWIGSRSMCQPCSMSFRVASAIALAEAGELEAAGRRLDEAERVAGMWNGGPWVAAVWEARGVQRRAQGNEETAVALFREAATRYAAVGRQRESERCLGRIAGSKAPTS